MSDIIRLLPDSVANQIAAGEVVQQPSSAIKELVENSVDAGAKHITIYIKDAGRTLIQVIDDGVGMSETDARMAFERHATSKISKADDLFSLHTMGFRGEALASIAAVAQIDMKTRREEDEIGTHIEISGAKVIATGPIACSKGTNLAVKNLFFNVPGRRKFLKKDSVEFGNIVKEFERLALVNPGVELTLIHNDVTVHRLAATTVKQRIIDLFGKSMATQLVPVSTETPLVKLSGFICMPEYARKKGALQFLTVNGRNMRHPLFQKAVQSCYEYLIAHDAKPNFFIDFQVSPDSIDVNIHPTKKEIKFVNEFAIRQIIIAAVRESLGRFNAVPSIDFESTDVPEIPAFSPDSEAGHDVDFDPSYNPFAEADDGYRPESPTRSYRDVSSIPSGITSSSPQAGRHRVLNDWEKLYENFNVDAPVGSDDDLAIPNVTASAINGDAVNPGETLDMEVEASIPGAFQVRNRFIITPSHEGILVVDQHRAHLNVLYHKYISEIDAHDVSGQTLLFPETIELSASENQILDSIIDKMSEVGYALAYLGDNTWSINAVPSMLSNVNAVDSVRKILDNAAESGGSFEMDIDRLVAMGMARASAVKSGHKMTQKEIEHLLSELFKLKSPALTPDGLTVMALISGDQVAALFE
ncbi:MAG TPA: DNA mismatch repair endonuclease MutL [Candidatus Amulumruptor caecigallinarius]|uniref:DNA mismatch repair protein MutL n=1 Tax=Candidatus Amulumruptor caecigallinarius TaxID=2109911 RepID=A0A921E7I3_9BACT|nr:DNA mismatch repair endonuclease MutL [Candidatus Amulumruptor caecigallinarius]